MVPEARTGERRNLCARIPEVDDSKALISMSVSSSPSSVFELFLRALLAQSGSGFIRSNCRRKRDSYSRPGKVSSLGASRSFLRRFEDNETLIWSESSIHAGALRFDFRLFVVVIFFCGGSSVASWFPD